MDTRIRTKRDNALRAMITRCRRNYRAARRRGDAASADYYSQWVCTFVDILRRY